MKYVPSLQCSYPLSAGYSCNENVTYWLDGNRTLKPTSQLNLGMFFTGVAASIMINLQGLFEDYSANRFFLCQKQCRLKGKKKLSFLALKALFWNVKMVFSYHETFFGNYECYILFILNN